MKLLIVEDNHLLAASLKNQLQSTYIVDIAATGELAIDLATTTEYSGIILDLNLPDMHGQKVCETLRHKGITSPIIIATATKDPSSCITLLDCGADDYVTKPYNIDVLRARVQALLRRGSQKQSSEQLRIEDLVLDLHSRSVKRGGIPIKLRRKEFDILAYLIRNRGRAVTRSMIFNHVWEAGKETWNNTVDVHIKYLRDKVDKPFGTQLIKTAHGIGYMVDNSE